MKKGTNIDEPSITAYAARFGNLKVFRSIIKSGVPLDSNAYNEAALYGNIDILKYIYKHFDTENSFPLESAIKSGDKECIEFIMNNKPTVTLGSVTESYMNGYTALTDLLVSMNPSLKYLNDMCDEDFTERRNILLYYNEHQDTLVN